MGRDVVVDQLDVPRHRARVVDANAIPIAPDYARQQLIIPLRKRNTSSTSFNPAILCGSRRSVQRQDVGYCTAQRHLERESDLCWAKTAHPGGGEESPAPKADAPEKQADIVISSPTDSAK
jgi:hypothetical protein